MNQPVGAGRHTAAIIALLLSVAALPAWAQSVGGATGQFCWSQGGRLVCQPAGGAAGAAGLHSYERWQDGSAAQATGSSATAPVRRSDRPARFYSGAYNSVYGFGR